MSSLVILTCYKASSATGRSPIPDAQIHIAHPLPPDEAVRSLEGWRTIYHCEARQLADVLMASLPQGTIHELLLVLLQRYSSVYQGPTTDAGPLTQTSEDGVLR